MKAYSEQAILYQYAYISEFFLEVQRVTLHCPDGVEWQHACPGTAKLYLYLYPPSVNRRL